MALVPLKPGEEESTTHITKHIDDKNCPVWSDVLTLSCIVEIDGQLYRLTVIAYNKKAAIDAWKRLQSLRTCGPLIEKYLCQRYGFTSPAMLSLSAADYHASFPNQKERLMVLWNVLTQSVEGTLICTPKGHLSKAMTYGQQVQALIQSLFGDSL